MHWSQDFNCCIWGQLVSWLWRKAFSLLVPSAPRARGSGINMLTEKLHVSGKPSLDPSIRAPKIITSSLLGCWGGKAAKEFWTWLVALGRSGRTKLCVALHRSFHVSFCYLLFRVDSIMLLEEGFKVTSIDASDKMLKYALKKRWRRRKEEAFDNWGKQIWGERSWEEKTQGTIR